MNLIGGLSSVLLGGLSNEMIYKAKIFFFVGAFLYWALLTPSWENTFRYWRYTRRWTHLRFSWEEGQIWLHLCFCKIMGRNPVSGSIMSRSCNKTHFCMIYIV